MIPAQNKYSSLMYVALMPGSPVQQRVNVKKLFSHSVQNFKIVNCTSAALKWCRETNKIKFSISIWFVLERWFPSHRHCLITFVTHMMGSWWRRQLCTRWRHWARMGWWYGRMRGLVMLLLLLLKVMMMLCHMMLKFCRTWNVSRMTENILSGMRLAMI